MVFKMMQAVASVVIYYICQKIDISNMVCFLCLEDLSSVTYWVKAP